MGRKNTQVTKTCLQCHEEFKTLKCTEHIRKFCSQVCAKSNVTWRKAISSAKKGVPRSKASIQKSILGAKKHWETHTKLGMIGSENPAWKETGAGMVAIHAWVRRRLPKISCEHCGIQNTKDKAGHSLLHYANKSGSYMRVLSDWLVLCVKCHSAYDKTWLKRKRDGKGKWI